MTENDLINDGISRVVNSLNNQLTQSREAAKEIVHRTDRVAASALLC
jgi:hypothetical protein